MVLKMDIKSFIKDTNKISKIATMVIFLALIRTISEPFRLQYYSQADLTYEQVKPFLVGGLVASVGLLVITLLSFYGKHKTIIAVCILTIISMLIVKRIYF